MRCSLPCATVILAWGVTAGYLLRRRDEEPPAAGEQGPAPARLRGRQQRQQQQPPPLRRPPDSARALSGPSAAAAGGGRGGAGAPGPLRRLGRCAAAAERGDCIGSREDGHADPEDGVCIWCCGLACVAGATAQCAAAAARQAVGFSGRADGGGSGAEAGATCDDPVLQPRALRFVPPHRVRPGGWLRAQLRVQAEGLGGHLDKLFPNRSRWLGGQMEPDKTYPHWNLESVPYWLFGLAPHAALLDDARLAGTAEEYLDWAVANQLSDGTLGPAFAAPGGLPGNDDPWPRYRMTSALAEAAESFPARAAALARAVAAALRRFLVMLRRYGPQMRRRSGWAHARWHELLRSAQWLLDEHRELLSREGEAGLVELMGLARQTGLDWEGFFGQRECAPGSADTHCFPCHDAQSRECAYAESQYMCSHGVNVAQSLASGALEWRLSRREAARGSALLRLRRLRECHGQPGAVASAHEVIDGRNPNRGTELCHVVESADSHALMLSAFGDPAMADAIEEMVLNRLPAAWHNGTMWRVAYFHQTNSVGACAQYGLPFECCDSNGPRGWPAYARRLFAVHRPSGGVAVVFYAESELRPIELPGGARLGLTVRTRYPFEGAVRITARASAGAVLLLRIPAWAEGATVQVGAATDRPVAGSFHVMQVAEGETEIALHLPLRPRVAADPGGGGGVTVHAGPLLFALNLPDQGWRSGPWDMARRNPDFPKGAVAEAATQYWPEAKAWRQALVLPETEPQRSGALRLQSDPELMRALDAERPPGPWAAATAPVRVLAQTRAVRPDAWATEHCTAFEAGCKACAAPPPPISGDSLRWQLTGPLREVGLVPFGATDLRLGVMPAAPPHSPHPDLAAPSRTPPPPQRVLPGAAARSSSAGCLISEGGWYHGDYLADTKAEDADSCAAKCRQLRGCRFFSFRTGDSACHRLATEKGKYAESGHYFGECP